MAQSVVCRQCQTSFTITDWEESFYQRISVPVPALCGLCRLQRRLAWRNERFLYQRKCDLCQQSMISLYSPTSRYTVYCKDCWWSDRWAATDYARSIDWSKPFFEQFHELMQTVPRLGLIISHGENSDYCTNSVYYKDSYMCVSGVKGENNLYCYFMNDSRDCVDSGAGFNCEQLYECLDCRNVSNSQFSIDCENSSDLFMCTDLADCSSCIGSVGLRHKQYYVYNKPVTPEYYQQVLAEAKTSLASIQSVRRQHIQLLLQTPQPYRRVKAVEQCSGDHIYNSQQADWAFDASNLDQAAYVWNIPHGAQDIVDANYSVRCELSYNIISNVNGNNNLCVCTCWDSPFTQYSMECFYSSSIFGCVGLKHGHHSILNKPYSETEYSLLRQRLQGHMQTTGEWGQFFPMELSPFPYHDTVAQERFPQPDSQSESITTPPGVTDDSKLCVDCRKPYRYIKQELDFYQRQLLPAPNQCHNCRYRARMARRNPTQLWPGRCASCHADFLTTYSPDRKQVIYCESCYQKTIY